MTQTRTRTASRKRALAPDASTLDDRSVRAWTERMAVSRLDDGRYLVDGESDVTYEVDLKRGTCTCPDRRIRGERCKHLRRVAIEINLGRVEPPDSEPDTCRGCGRVLTAPATGPPPLCPSCAVEPGEYVVDRETGDTLEVVAVRERTADEVVIPEFGSTVAEYPTNAEYPSSDPVIDVTYPGSGTDPPRVYSFPLSRIRRFDRTDDGQLTLSDHRGRA